MLNKILIVDDHVWLRRLLAQYLCCKFSPVEVIQAADAETGLFLTEKDSPNLIIMDVVLPRMNGIDATRLLKQSIPDVPVIILTAYDEPCYRQASLEAGADDFISKGAIKAALIPAVERLLKIVEPAN